jgi:hypothetical protein
MPMKITLKLGQRRADLPELRYQGVEQFGLWFLQF